jgi:hypothetical protein
MRSAASDNGCIHEDTTRKDLDMRPFTPRKRSSARTSTPDRGSQRVLQDILTGPDTAHRRELEILLEERAR